MAKPKCRPYCDYKLWKERPFNINDKRPRYIYKCKVCKHKLESHTKVF